MNNDLQELSKWFNQNNLVENMKKGKTEFLLYGTAKRISQQTRGSDVDLNIDGIKVCESGSYQYLGVIMDSNLVFTDEYLQKLYKKGSTRVKLLSAVRLNIPPHLAETIYETMI